MIFFPEKSRKEKKIEQILLQNYDRYYRLAYSYVHKEADAADIVQNGAYKAILNSDTLRKEEYASTWVYRIMLNETFRFLKKERP
ncbi:MAG: sigma factor, partial [Lachnospiraceae bacterium]|nr:sigma factor [Lachnospiraceae bacterium]